jgi:HAD superfamily hydrolase (TIGR01490 family)
MIVTAAFFDLDRTVLSVNSGMLWAVAELREGRISARQFGRAALWSALYHLSLADMDAVAEAALSHYAGTPAADLEARVRAWFDRDVARRVRPAALARIAHHRDLGHTLVLLTNSSCYEAAAAAARFGFDAALATTLAVDRDGRLTGSFERPLCYGAGKVTRAEAWAAARGADLDRAWFYGDSLGDLPMLARVGHPRAVTPDPRLRREARRRGWPILSW